jgi:hypothetical protein
MLLVLLLQEGRSSVKRGPFFDGLTMRLELESGGKTALATADVARGWRRLRNTFGFCEESRLELTGDEILRVQASIHAWPNFFGSRLAQLPPVYGRLERVWGSSEVRGEGLRIIVDIPKVRLERLPKSGLPGFYEMPTELDKQERVEFWFSVLVTVATRLREIIQTFSNGIPNS